ncbi:MAG: type II toxin-antitoxin system VapC family toxin [Nitrososphaerota archaeon]|jgi:predicted nucleic acid-binding protein|nr:type II toxin-antitoxin system VapC family toxin [Nitrososphaerota archaeon]MDG6960245.1 type II toxin-antitoxin system VapC family toxin [Nitrososphaerota archaeon]MDG6976982.1 type II toxin-antitoxin system VapC family toxin [Nitrososphaerota archaeon]MDG7014984.1 type II toxin-antitoxin system VapC family toxin [Nitrososphaerota archaeon]WGO50940.1 MAG: type II toxin-antitoxin system VapC family toxin [Nitrososphaerota archaeon]
MERGKEIVILDASVVVKWFVDEEHTEAALTARDDYRDGRTDIWSTQLLPFEVLNALRYNPGFGLDELKSAARALEQYRLALHPVLGEMAEVSATAAVDLGITLYDAAYVALAKTMGRKMYTADEKLLAKAAKVKEVTHIEEYSPPS